MDPKQNHLHVELKNVPLYTIASIIVRNTTSRKERKKERKKEGRKEIIHVRMKWAENKAINYIAPCMHTRNDAAAICIVAKPADLDAAAAQAVDLTSRASSKLL